MPSQATRMPTTSSWIAGRQRGMSRVQDIRSFKSGVHQDGLEFLSLAKDWRFGHESLWMTLRDFSDNLGHLKPYSDASFSEALSSLIQVKSSHESQDLHHRFHPLVSSRQSFCDKWQLNQAKKAGFLRSSWGWWLYNRWIDEFSSETSCAFHQKLRNQQIQRFPPSQDQLSQATMRLIRDQQNRLYTELWPQASITFHSAECQCHRKQRTRYLLGFPANDRRFKQLYRY